MKKTTRNLILLFLGVFVIKIIVSLFYKGTFFYSDEACVVQKAIHFSETFRLANCAAIAGAPAGDPLPFYSVIISPIYLFLRGMSAYYGVLILNSLLIASLAFPLYSIIKKFISNEKVNYLIVFVALFLPQITVFEKMLMTEAIFIVFNIWTLYFYLESFSKNKARNKTLAIIFASLAALIRPFGFIVLFSITVNEFIISKNKKLTALVLLPITIIAIVIAFTFLGGLAGMLISKILSLAEPAFLRDGFKAVKDQINSFSLATFLVPIVIFFTYIWKKDSENLNKIRYFLLTFIFLNFIISANHMHGYILEGIRTATLTRYINISIIFILLFSLIFIFRYKKFKLNTPNVLVLIVTFLCLFALQYESTKHSLNLDLSLYYDTTFFTGGNMAAANNFIPYYFVPIVLGLFILLASNKKKLFIPALIIILLIQGFGLYIWERNFGRDQQVDDALSYLKNTEYNLLFIESYNRKLVDFTFWRVITLTKNHSEAIYFNDKRYGAFMPDFSSEKGQKLLEEKDYVVSNFDLNLPISATLKDGTKLYRISETAKIPSKIYPIIERAWKEGK